MREGWGSFPSHLGSSCRTQSPPRPPKSSSFSGSAVPPPKEGPDGHRGDIRDATAACHRASMSQTPSKSTRLQISPPGPSTCPRSLLLPEPISANSSPDLPRGPWGQRRCHQSPDTAGHAWLCVPGPLCSLLHLPERGESAASARSDAPGRAVPSSGHAGAPKPPSCSSPGQGQAPPSLAAGAPGTAFRAQPAQEQNGGVSDPSPPDAGAPRSRARGEGVGGVKVSLSRPPAAGPEVSGQGRARGSWQELGRSDGTVAMATARRRWTKHNRDVQGKAGGEQRSLRSPTLGGFGVTPPRSIRNPQTQQRWINP